MVNTIDTQSKYLSNRDVMEKEKEDKLYSFLIEHPDGCTIQQLSVHLKLNRNTIVKILAKFDGAGKVTIRRVGTAKLYTAIK